MASSTPHCRHKAACTNPACPYLHPAVIPCRYGERCRDKATCPYAHGPAVPRPCRYGAGCWDKAACPYTHPEGSTSDTTTITTSSSSSSSSDESKTSATAAAASDDQHVLLVLNLLVVDAREVSGDRRPDLEAYLSKAAAAVQLLLSDPSLGTKLRILVAGFSGSHAVRLFRAICDAGGLKGHPQLAFWMSSLTFMECKRGYEWMRGTCPDSWRSSAAPKATMLVVPCNATADRCMWVLNWDGWRVMRVVTTGSPMFHWVTMQDAAVAAAVPAMTAGQSSIVPVASDSSLWEAYGISHVVLSCPGNDGMFGLLSVVAQGLRNGLPPLAPAQSTSPPVSHEEMEAGWKRTKAWRVDIIKETMAVVRRGWYVAADAKVVLNQAALLKGASAAHKCFATGCPDACGMCKGITPATVGPLVVREAGAPDDTDAKDVDIEPATTAVHVVCMDSIDAGKVLLDAGFRPVVLNLANAHSPGGAYLAGAGAQEENLHRRSNYFQVRNDSDSSGSSRASHVEQHLHNPDNVPRIVDWRYPIEPHDVVYSSSIAVVRANEAKRYEFLPQPHWLSFIAAAAIARPQLTREGRLRPDTEALTVTKIRSILRSAKLHGHDALVLGAFGCGAFRNPPDHIAELFHRVLAEAEFALAFRHIVFAILEDKNSRQPHNPDGNLIPFALEFGVEVVCPAALATAVLARG